MSADIVGLPQKDSSYRNFPSIFREFDRFMRADAQGDVPTGTIVSQGEFHFIPDFLDGVRLGYFVQVDQDGEICDLFTCYNGIPIKETLILLDSKMVTLEGLSLMEVWDIPSFILEAARGS